MKQNICLSCEQPKLSQKGIRCKSCSYKYKTRKSGLKYTLHKINPTSFKKSNIPWHKGIKTGVIPWNKGTKGIMKPNSGSFEKGLTPWNYKGDMVGYGALHVWIRREKGKPKQCSNCGERDSRLSWANISHEYKRDPDDYMPLCTPCHTRYDLDTGWGVAKKLFPNGKRVTI